MNFDFEILISADDRYFSDTFTIITVFLSIFHQVFSFKNDKNSMSLKSSWDYHV